MQGVVLREVEKLLFRQNVATRAQYYGLCFLSQFYLYHEDIEVARHLIEVYFSFFKACVKKVNNTLNNFKRAKIRFFIFIFCLGWSR